MSDFTTRPEFDRIVEILREDLQNAKDDLKGSMGHGFSEINKRLDTLNGKTNDHAIRIVVLEKAKGQIDLATLLSIVAAAAAIWALFV